MKKIFIGSLVGGIILFMWHFMSWMITPIHHDTFKYTTAQDSIVAVMKNAGLADGMYIAPMTDMSGVSALDFDAKQKAHDQMMKNVGKPMVAFNYTSSMPGMDPVQPLMGFIYDLISVFCVVMLLSLAYQSNASFFMRWWMVMLFAVLFIMEGPLMMRNWMHEPWHYTKGFVYDAIIGWGLTGLWLAKYLRKT